MDLNLLNLIEQLKKEDEKVKYLAKQMKKYEDLIKNEEDIIKQLLNEKAKLINDLKTKMEQFSKVEIEHDILETQKSIWTDELQRAQQELIEGQKQLEALQQSVCANRIAFCDKVKDLCNKNDCLAMSRTFACENSPANLLSSIFMTEIKVEPNHEECNDLEETVRKLESELEELKLEEARIEEIKQLKLQLLAEPSCGEQFLRLQNQLKEMKDELQNVELQVSKVKREIAQKELQLANQKFNSAGSKPGSSQGSSFQKYVSEEKNGHAPDHNEEKGATDPKVVKFNDSVETREIQSSAQLKSILKVQNFRENSQTPSLKRKIAQQRSAKLDEEMNKILFKKGD